jgi:hypothetical protein
MQEPKIHVFVRHCASSEASKGKARPTWFDREKIFRNLLKTSEDSNVSVTVVLDVASMGSTFAPDYFVYKHKDGKCRM